MPERGDDRPALTSLCERALLRVLRRSWLTARVERFGKLVRAVYEETGSINRAVSFAARFLYRKVPALLRRGLHPAKRPAAIRAEIHDARVADNNAPLIAVRIGGVIGDHIVIARFMRDLAASVEEIRFDVYSGIPDHARWLFASVKGFRNALSDARFDSVAGEYDVSLTLNQAAILHEEHARRATLRRHSKLAGVCSNIVRYRPKIDTFVANQPLLADALARHALFANATRRDFLHRIADIPYGGDALEVTTDAAATSRFGLAGKTYVTVHNGYDQNFTVSSGGLATKCYPHFGSVLAELKAAFPSLLTVQLGTSTSDPLAEADLNLIDQTTVPEAAEILRHSILHLDNEGGLVHLASCFNVPSCVVFGPTPSSYFGYPGNLNIDPNFCGGCWWVNLTWMDRCPRGFATARCMSEQDPHSVARVVEGYLKQKMLSSESERIGPAYAAD
jgi:hypothetical protein